MGATEKVWGGRVTRGLIAETGSSVEWTRRPAGWCGRSGSNRHSFRNRILSPARLPIPPRPHRPMWPLGSVRSPSGQSLRRHRRAMPTSMFSVPIRPCGDDGDRAIERAFPFRTRPARDPEPPRRTRSSAGEHYVDIVGVTGSIPVASTILFFPRTSRLATSRARMNLVVLGMKRPDRLGQSGLLHLGDSGLCWLRNRMPVLPFRTSGTSPERPPRDPGRRRFSGRRC